MPYCFGEDGAGQLGRNDEVTHPTPVQAPRLAGAADVGMTNQSGCALLPTGSGGREVRCFGYQHAQLLNGAAPFGTAQPVVIDSRITDPFGLDVGYFGACTVSPTGGSSQVSCWGINNSGRYGPAGGLPTITGLEGAWPGNESDVSIGDTFICVLQAGAVFCAGNNNNGELGRGGPPGPGNYTMAAIEASLVGPGVTDISSGRHTTCARSGGGRLYCWGLGTLGQLGNDTLTSSTSPTQAVGLFRVVDFDAGRYHFCAIEGDEAGATPGIVMCWGHNNAGQVSPGDPADKISRPTSAGIGITDAIAVTAGDSHSCAVLASGEVRCWGDNTQGQLGDGTYEPRSAPVRAGTFTADVSSPFIDAGEEGGNTTCARAAGGNVGCWGDCAYGACARGSLTGPIPAPVSGW